MTYIKKLSANDSSFGESAFVLSCSSWGRGGGILSIKMLRKKLRWRIAWRYICIVCEGISNKCWHFYILCGQRILSSLFVLLWGKESGFIALDDLKVPAVLLSRPPRH